MNEKPTINWKWDVESGILYITSTGDGYVLLEVDNSIYEAGEDRASCSIKSAVGKTHQVKTCIYDNGSPENVVWTQSSYTVPRMEQNNGLEPGVTENSSNHNTVNQGTTGLGPGGAGSSLTTDTRKCFKTIDVRDKLHEMGTIKLSPIKFSNSPGNKTISFDNHIIPLKQPDDYSCWITSTVVLLTAIGIIEPTKINELLKTRSVDYVLKCVLEHLYNHNSNFRFNGEDVPIPWSPGQKAFCNNFYLLKKYRRPLPSSLYKQFYESLNGFSTESANYTADVFFKLLCDYGPLIVAYDADDGMLPFDYHIAVLCGIEIIDGIEAKYKLMDPKEENDDFVYYNESDFLRMYNQLAEDNLNNTEVEQAFGRNTDYFIPQVIHIPNKIDLGL